MCNIINPMKKGLLTLLMICSLGILTGFGQLLDPTSWSVSQKKTGDNDYELTFEAVLEPGWTMYSINTPDGGPLPTTLTFEKAGNGIELVGKPVETDPKVKQDEVFGVEVWYFTDVYKVTQKIRVTDPALAVAEVTVGFQACEESCVNLEKSFEVKLEGREARVEAAPDAAAEEGENDNLWGYFWFAFGAGLLAVVMPCVFPMIPMTVSFFMHGNPSKTQARSKAVFFSMSIIAIYTGLGLMISFLFGPGVLNWLGTHWIPNLFFFLIFIVFAASFFGAFEIVLPSSLVNKADKQADKGGYIGAFFMALTLVLVSFSCTVPIVSAVLVEASQGSVLRPIVGMLGFSIALALPFGFFAFFPSMLNSMKSGSWMNTVKVCLGFIEVAFAFKFLMVIDQGYHLNLLGREVYLAIWIANFSLMTLYLVGKIKFRHDSDLPFIGVGRLTMAMATFAFVIYLIPGMFGAPLKVLSGYSPPQESMDFDLNRLMRDYKNEIIESGISVGGSSSGAASSANVLDEPVLYAEYFKLPQGFKGYFDYDQAVRAAQKLDKPIFIDFTGKTCVNCRDMEQRVWSDPRIKKVMQEEYVIVALYCDTKVPELPKEEQYKSDILGKRVRNLGDKNSEFQVAQFNANAQPNYLLIDSRHGNAEVLKPHILAPPRGANYDIEGFYQFLLQGVEEYKKRK